MIKKEKDVIISDYTPGRANGLFVVIRNAARAGKPSWYEVRVDDQLVIPKTDDPSFFDSHQEYIEELSQFITFRLFKGNSQHSDLYHFSLENYDPAQKDASLNGIEKKTVQDQVQEGIREALREQEYQNTLKENQELKNLNQQLREANDNWKETYDDLQLEYSKLEAKKYTNADLSELAGFVFQGLTRRNPEVLRKIPGGQLLAGLMNAPAQAGGNFQPPESQEVEFEAMDEESNMDYPQEGQESANSADQAQELKMIHLIRLLHAKLNAETRAHLTGLLLSLYHNPSLVTRYAIQIRTETQVNH
ncbi:MAG: hypothetical protein H6581_20635 [Bacteroidia bacterium]|nr:hypothetical protein [Bacteroidia bacterium]